VSLLFMKMTNTKASLLKGLCVIACVFLAVNSSGLDSKPDDVLVPRREPIPSGYFAQNILFHPLNHVPWPSVPLGGWRTSHVNWADIQLQKDRWYFDLLDKYVGWSQAHGVEILMPLTYTPRWASAAPDAPADVESGSAQGLSGPPRDMEDWRIFVRTIATRYRGRIHNWEIWNEPNRPQSWSGSVETLVEMTREASIILKEIDPHCTVVSPAPTGGYGLAFLDKFLSQGGGQYADVIGFHFYVGHDDPPEAMVLLIDKVKSIMEKYGLSSKPLWNTEAGWLGPNLLPQDLQSAYIARAFILNWADGVNRFYWFAWENRRGTEIELVEGDNSTLTPAGRAFATTQAWMTGAVMTRCIGSPNGIWMCDLKNRKGVSHILWNTKGTLTFPIPEGWRHGSVYELDGGRTPIQGMSIAIGIEPILIE
jgi:hypothetical protein